MKAEVNPSSLFNVQDLAGSQTPDTGAYPDGPPRSRRVNQTAKSCFSGPGDARWRRSAHLLTPSKDFFAKPSLICNKIKMFMFQVCLGAVFFLKIFIDVFVC